MASERVARLDAIHNAPESKGVGGWFRLGERVG